MTSALQLEFLDLRHFSSQHLRPLLDEESALWSSRLRWDYRNSASLVLQYVESHLLTGYVALDQGRVCGYIFCVYEGHKAVIGDVFVSRHDLDEEAAAAIEERLIDRLLETLQNTPGLTRIEAQLLLHPHGLHRGSFERAGFRIFPRLFMYLDLGARMALPPREPSDQETEGVEGARYRKWTPQDFEIAPHVITGSYTGHIDSEINDQYLSVGGAQRFLHNIVHFPGCGIFEEQSSWVLSPPGSHKLLALLLCSRVSSGVGHVTQLCVLPRLHHRGVGTRLMELCASSLAARDCDAITLTVTERNAAAVGLYERLGYKVRHRFDAMLWDRNLS